MKKKLVVMKVPEAFARRVEVVHRQTGKPKSELLTSLAKMLNLKPVKKKIYKK